MLASASETQARVDVTKGACGSNVRLVASDARLSEVLQQLADTLDFKLEFKSASDPIINISVSRPAAELVAKLVPNENVIVSEAPDSRCPQQRRIAKVWVLPNPKATGTAVAPPPPAPPPKPAMAATPPPAPVDPERRDRLMKLRKELEDAYIKKHGGPPPSLEEEIRK